MKIKNMAEGITANDNSLKELASGAGISFVFGVVGYILMFLFKLIAARYFGPHDYGIYEMINTILMLSVVFAGFGISAGISRFVPYFKHSGKTALLKGYLKFIFTLPFITSLLISALLFFLSDKITNFLGFDESFSQLIKIVSVFIPIRTISQILRQLLGADKKIFYRSFSMDFLEKIILLISICVIYFLNLPVLFLILALVLSILFTFIFDLFFYKTKVVLPASSIAETEIKDWLNFSLPLFFTGFFAFFIQWSDNLIIGKFLSADMLGIYAVAFSLGSFILLFQAMFTNIFNPLIAEKYAKNEHQQISFLFKKASSWTFALSFPVLAFILSYGKETLGVLYGKEYVLGFAPMVIIAMGMFIFVVIGLNECLLILHKKTKFIFKINLVTAIYNFFACIIFIKLWGILGASIATASSFVLKGIFAFLKSRKLEGISFDLNYNLKFLLASSLSAIGILLTKTILTSNSFYSLILIFLQFLISYLVLIYLLKIFKEEDKDILNKISSKIFKIFQTKKL